MFGIEFDGFDDGTGLGLRPLLLPEGFEGTPLRKSFVLAARASKAWPGAKEPGEGHDSAASARPPPRAGPRCPRSRVGAAVNLHLAPWLEVVLRAVAVLAAFLVLPLLVGQTEHKVMAHMQGRLGPMYAGGFHGWAQLVADGVKFVQKEDITPARADRWVFRLAPFVALIPYLVALAVIPLSPRVVGADVDASVVLVLAVIGVGIIGTLMAGWASANKYSLLGAMRAAAQLVSYELPMVLAVASVALAAGTLSLVGIAERLAPVVAALAAARRGRLPRRGPRRAPAPALRHAAGRLRDRLRRLHRVHRAALRVLPARRVRRHRRHVAALRGALPRRLGRALRAVGRLAVDGAQGLRSSRSSSSGCASRGRACARTSSSASPGCGSCRWRSSSSPSPPSAW